MSFAVLHIEKIHSISELSGKFARNDRTLHPENADKNIPLLECENVVEKWKKLAGNQKVRKNAVYAVDFLLSASPEYFRPKNPTAAGEYEEDRMQAWAKKTFDWLKQKHGDNLLSVHLHLDEATPHIQALTIPLDANKKLNAKSIYGGKKKMIALQDEYYDAVKSIGLQRGIKGSRAKHRDVKKYYADVNAALNEQMEPTQVKDIVIAKALDRDRLERERDEAKRQAAKLQSENDKLKSENERLINQIAGILREFAGD